MTQDDYDALKELLRGAALGSALFIGLIATFAAIVAMGDRPDTPKMKFEVVDHYKDCDVVRYTDPTQRWEYFLHCESQ